MTIGQLKALIASGNFHHATMRIDSPSLWNGLWIYEKDDVGRGFKPAGAFYNSDRLAQDIAYHLVRDSGVSMGAYGHG